MSSKHERHARSRWEWGSQPSRHDETAAIVEDQVADFNKVPEAPGRKDRRVHCKSSPGGSHVRVLYLKLPIWVKKAITCGWGVAWDSRAKTFGIAWRCLHQEGCSWCGKIFRTHLEDKECPYWPGTSCQRAEAQADAVRAQERRRQWDRRKPVITGPQGYRRRRKSN